MAIMEEGIYKEVYWETIHQEVRRVNPKLAEAIDQIAPERSHKSDAEEFYQLIDYKDDVDLSKKLSHWEKFYNCHRPHGGLKGKTPYEILKIKMNDISNQSLLLNKHT